MTPSHMTSDLRDSGTFDEGKAVLWSDTAQALIRGIRQNEWIGHLEREENVSRIRRKDICPVFEYIDGNRNALRLIATRLLKILGLTRSRKLAAVAK